MSLWSFSADSLLDFLAEVRRQGTEAYPEIGALAQPMGLGFTVYYDEEAKLFIGWKVNKNGSNKHFLRSYIDLSSGSSAPVLGNRDQTHRRTRRVGRRVATQTVLQAWCAER